LFKCARHTHTLSLLCSPLGPDVPQANPKRSKEEEEDRGDKNDHVKKRKKAKKDYQPNYFLSIPITNKKVRVSQESVFARKFYSEQSLKNITYLSAHLLCGSNTI
jgi:hypothetical protein